MSILEPPHPKHLAEELTSKRNEMNEHSPDFVPGRFLSNSARYLGVRGWFGMLIHFGRTRSDFLSGKRWIVLISILDMVWSVAAFLTWARDRRSRSGQRA